MTVTVTNVDTGRYKAAFTIPSGGAQGDTCTLSIAATVSSIAGKGIVWQAVLDKYRIYDITDGSTNARADLKAWLAVAPAALTTNGYLQAALLRWLTDNAAGTPLALSSNLVQATIASNIKKNQALSGFQFPMFDSTDHVTPLPGLTVTAQRSIDGGAFTATTNSPSAISGGYYKIDLSAADLNGNTVELKFTATGADQTSATIVTVP